MLSYIEYAIVLENLTTLYANGALAGALAILVVGGFVFALIGRLLVLLERLRRPTVFDHLRRCALLYVTVAILAVLLITTYETQAASGVSTYFGVAVICFLTASYAALTDALILPLERRHFERAGSDANP